MSSFHELGDEFAGDAANEEWDAAWEAYTSGAETNQGVLSAPLRAALRLPTGRVELRGDVDDEVVDVLIDLHDSHEPVDDVLGIDEPSHLATFLVRRSEPMQGDDGDRVTPDQPASTAPWWLEQHEHGTVADGTGWESLTTALLTRLEQVSIAADTGQLHLEAACVELDGVGIVLAGGSANDRDPLLHALLAAGAGYLTRDDLVLQPGTRAVRGTPTPLPDHRSPGDGGSGDGGPVPRLVPARHLAPVLAQCAVGVIVWMSDPSDSPSAAARTAAHAEGPAERTTEPPQSRGGATGEPRPAALAEIDAASAVRRLVDSLRPSTPISEVAVDLLGLFVAGATSVELPDPSDDATDDGLGALVAAIRAVGPPDRRRLAARFHWQVAADAAPAGGGRRNRRGAVAPPTRRRLVRFERGAVLWDGADGTVSLLGDDEADRCEAEAVAQLQQRPGPDAFGLPNCPTGATARELWAAMSILEPVPGPDTADEVSEGASAPDPDALPTGVAAELVSRGLVATDDAERARAVARHIAGRERTEAAAAALTEVLDLAARSDVVPVVVGSVAQAFDGPLPGHFTDVDRIDLLVRKDDLDRLADDLEAHGYVTPARRLNGTSLVKASDRRLEHPDRPGITVDLHGSLAAGPFGELVDPEEFHRRAVPFRLGDRWVAALHPEHRFVHACVRADRGGGREHLVELRDVVLTSPQAAPLLAAAMECSARWGATTSVLAVVRSASSRLPGLPAWLVERSRHHDAPGRRRRRRSGRL